MATAKKGPLFRIKMRRVDNGIEIEMTTDPALSESFRTECDNNAQSWEGEARYLNSEGKRAREYLRVPQAAMSLLDLDLQLVPWMFQPNPRTIVVPVSRSKEQLVNVATHVRDFLAKWYEDRIQPLEVETTVSVRTSDPVETAAAPSTEEAPA